MDNKREKQVSWWKGPIISKKWDLLVNFALAFTGAMLSMTVYPLLDIPFWQFLILLIPVALLLVIILKLLGTAWRNRREQRDD